MSENKNDTPPSTPANPKGFEPLDVSNISRRTAAAETKDPTQQRFDAVYTALRSAVERGDTQGYVEGLKQLRQLMGTEVYQHHGHPNAGDLHYTFVEWQSRNAYLTTVDADRIKAGLNVNKNSNTIDNNFRPHHDFPGDTTMARNSKEFGGVVTGYINARGRGYIAGSLVPGATERDSAFMILTVFKGFPKALTAK
jgi:hypothetical protein